MKLYFSEGACSMASHIALNEAGVSYTPVSMSFDQGDFSKPEFLALNPMGAVPVLELDDGRALTEGVAIMQYVASLHPEAGLAPKTGTPEHYTFLKWMNFIATELHKGFSPLFYTSRITKNEEAQQDIRSFTLRALDECFEVVDNQLAKTPYLCGQTFTVADGYLFTVMSWAQWTKVDYSRHKNLAAHVARIAERPAVLKTLQLEEK